MTAQDTTPAEWQPLDAILLGVVVEVETVTGILCLARAKRSADGTPWIKPADRRFPRRCGCTRVDGATSGDVWAVRWREVDARAKRQSVPLAQRVGKSRSNRLSRGWARREVIIPDCQGARDELAAAVEAIRLKYPVTDDETT